MSATVYRAFMSDGRLLYVGRTLRGAHRLAEHVDKPWWPEVAQITLTHFADEPSAIAAENDAIRDEGPLYNVAQVVVLADGVPLSLRIERERLDAFRRVAEANRRSVSQELRWLIDRHVEDNPADATEAAA